MAKTKLDAASSAKKSKSANDSATRETVESLAVALILALLFRGFVAEAFIIPTGSMAPALMGAHKDVFCGECGARYQTGASGENDDRQTGLVVSSFCENCRHENPVAFNQGADATFSGDRIMVSKFAYSVRDPQRWDVIVFKYPYNAKQNYIKRLVGLPGETIYIQHGDVLRSIDDGKREVLRKPDDKLMAMRHLVYDTKYQSENLIKAGYPSRWQPWTENQDTVPENGWTINQKDSTWSAQFSGKKTSDSTAWIRYFHNVPRDQEWNSISQNGPLKEVSPYRSSAITDFYAYNSHVMVAAEDLVAAASQKQRRFVSLDAAKAEFQAQYQTGLSRSRLLRDGWQVMDGATGEVRSGLHWVGDLMLEAELEVTDSSGSLVVELIEAGRRFQCKIETSSGAVSLVMTDQNGAPTPLGQTGSCPVQGEGSYDLRFSNCDDEVRLWINGRRIDLGDTTYAALPPDQNYPHYSKTDPLDAAPAGIGAVGGAMTVERLAIYRDKYYTSIDSNRTNSSDYRPSFPERQFFEQITATLQEPTAWENSSIWSARRVDVQFQLLADQFMPMGDNSPASSDGRCWGPDSFVQRDLLTGKALLIFWPHPWHGFLPHFSRMGLIR